MGAQGQWQPIETAPKDGTWFLAYRSPVALGTRATLVAITWQDDAEDFVWPSEIYDAYSPPDLDALDDCGFYLTDVYSSQGSFTHWMPLPEPPSSRPEASGQ